MHKSGQEVPGWMLELKADPKAWKKLEKVPTYRKPISTKARETAPKRFLKQMDKNIRRSGQFA